VICCAPRYAGGGVNTLDTDYDVAQYFDIECAVEAPFSPTSSEIHSRNVQLIKEANRCIAKYLLRLANLKNLEAAVLAKINL
jgi:hypothetical protein